MIKLPPCPKLPDKNNLGNLRYCKGVLVPLSLVNYTYAKWKCTVCGHEIK